MSERPGGSGRYHDHPDNRGVWVETWVIDVCEGDLPAALLLSQLLWWHQPGKSGRQKLRFERGGFLWLTREDTDWWDECRLTLRQVRRIRQMLRRLGLVEHKVVRGTGGTTISAWRPQLEAIQELIELEPDQDSDAPGVTSGRQSGDGPGVTSARQSGVTPGGQSHGSDAGTSVQSDAGASLPSSFLEDEKDNRKTVATPGASQPVPMERRIVNEWWDESAAAGRKPIEKYMGVVQIVKRCLSSGFEEDEVAAALREVPCVTVPAMARYLRSQQRKGRSVGDDNVDQALTWLNGEATGGD